MTADTAGQRARAIRAETGSQVLRRRQRPHVTRTQAGSITGPRWLECACLSAKDQPSLW